MREVCRRAAGLQLRWRSLTFHGVDECGSVAICFSVSDPADLVGFHRKVLLREVLKHSIRSVRCSGLIVGRRSVAGALKLKAQRCFTCA